jgi:hypothetical protein
VCARAAGARAGGPERASGRKHRTRSLMPRCGSGARHPGGAHAPCGRASRGARPSCTRQLDAYRAAQHVARDLALEPAPDRPVARRALKGEDRGGCQHAAVPASRPRGRAPGWPGCGGRRVGAHMPDAAHGRSGSCVIQYGVVGVGGVVKRRLTAHSRPAATVAVEGTSRLGSVRSPRTTPRASRARSEITAARAHCVV